MQAGTGGAGIKKDMYMVKATLSRDTVETKQQQNIGKRGEREGADLGGLGRSELSSK